MFDSDDGSYDSENVPFIFRPFTREEFDAIESRIREEKERTDASEGEIIKDDYYLEPDYTLETSLTLPKYLLRIFPEELRLTPLVDIDPYYKNKRTFIVISGNILWRFSATKALWIFTPFNQTRRIAIYILLHPKLALVMMGAVIFNCLLMAIRKNSSVEASESLFTAIYTFEFIVRTVAEGLILERFTHLRQPWNWVDFIVLALEYLPTGVDMSSLRALRVLRALKAVTILPGLKSIVNAVIESAKNLRDVMILTFFALCVLALLGMQIYRGVLTRKCVRTISDELLNNMTIDEIDDFRQNSSNWFMLMDDDEPEPQVCGNTSSATKCPDDYTCYSDIGTNPNHDFTSFDEFDLAMLAAFRIMTQDAWDKLCRMIIRAMGPWHMLYFIFVIFLGAHFLLNLILAITDLSFAELKAREAIEREDVLLDDEEENDNQEDINVANIVQRYSPTASHKDDIVTLETGLAEGSSHANVVSENTGAGCATEDVEFRSDEECKQAYITQRLLGFEANTPRRTPGENQNTPQQTDQEQRVIIKDLKSSRSDIPNESDVPIVVKGATKWSWNTLKDLPRTSCIYFIDTFCVWECCECWRKFQKILRLIVQDAFVELFIAICIIINTVFLAMDHYGIDEDLDSFLEQGNFILAIIFAAEVVLKIIALSPKNFFKQKWNTFEFCVAGSSIFDRLFSLVKTLPMMRSLRLLRIFKLAKSWPTLNLLLTIMYNCLQSLGNLCLVLVTIIFIFTVMGMELFGDSYELNKDRFPHGEVPRWHFGDFIHSFLIVFGVLCGEWIESMWNCMLVSGFMCVPYFLSIVLIGNMLLFNLFIAVLMSSFDSSNIVEVEDDYEITLAINRFKRFGSFLLSCLRKMRRKKVIHPKIQCEMMAVKNSAKSEISHTSLNALLDDFSERNDSGKQGQTNVSATILEDEVYNQNSGNHIEKTKSNHQMHIEAVGDVKSVKVGEFTNNKEFRSNQENAKEKLADVNGMKQQTLPNSSSREIDIIDENTEENTNDSFKSLQSAHSSKTEVDDDQIVAEELDRYALKMKTEHITKPPENGAVYEIRSDNYENKLKPSPSNITKNSETSEAECASEKKACKYRMKSAEESPAGPGKHKFTGGKSKRHRQEAEEEENINNPVCKDIVDEEKGGEERECIGNVDLYYQMNCCGCFPSCNKKESIFWDKWFNVRTKAATIYNNPLHHIFVVLWILISCFALAAEDKNIDNKPFFRENVKYFDLVFEVFFLSEIILGMLGQGFKTQFTNPYLLMDFTIHVLSMISLFGSLFEVGNITYLRSLRALRPLRLLGRINGLHVITSSFAQAIPAIMNVILVCLIFWLIFSIMGVTMFAGKFSSCVDEESQKLDYQIVPNKSVCEMLNFTWENSKINFDNVAEGYLALFQVATFGGWVDIMNNAIDSREDADLQPIREYGIYKCLYFVFIIIFGTFFILNLFTSAIIETVAARRRCCKDLMYKYEEMSEDQMAYNDVMTSLSSWKPTMVIPKPKWKPQLIVFNIVTDNRFELLIMIIVGINMVLLAVESYNEGDAEDDYSYLLNTVNIGFVAILAVECLMKIFGLRCYYFRDTWNLFDFLVAMLAIIDILLEKFSEKGIVSPVIFRTVKGVRLIKLFRLVKGTRGVRLVIATLQLSLPNLVLTMILHFLVMFVYAIFGMHFFKNLELGGAFDENFNFGKFYPSIILLFQLSTAAGWDEVLEILTDDEKCPESSLDAGCPTPAIGVAYLVSYMIITHLIIINMYIAVIVESYDRITEQAIRGLNDDDFNMFFDTWKKYDPNATGYIYLQEFSDFLTNLESPMHIPKPNKIKIAVMDINIYAGDRIFYADVLNALVLVFFAYQEREVVNNKKPIPQKDLISTTLWRQREEYCARVIQRAWRKYRIGSTEDTTSTVIQAYYNSIMQELEQVLTGKLPRRATSHRSGKSN